MKIVNVNKFYYLRGGAERYFFSLADLLTEHGHEVIPFAMQHPNNLDNEYSRYFPSYVEFGQARKENDVLKFPISNFQFPNKFKIQNSKFKILSRMFWSFETARKFDALLRDVKPDLIHLHNIYHQLSPSFLSVAKRHGIPVVMTVHDYALVWPDYLLCGYPTSPQPSPPRRGRGYWNVVRERCTQESYAKSFLSVLEKKFHDWLRVYHKHIDLFFAPSEFVKERLIAGGYDAKKIRVLPHFVKSPFHPPFQKGEREGFVSPSILYFGRLSKEKGLDILLKMMHSLGSEVDPVRGRSPHGDRSRAFGRAASNGVELRIAGNGPEENRLRMRNEELGMKNVVFLGRLDATALTQEIDRALFVVAPSIVPETFGYTILESFAHGKPVVASRIGAFPELVRDGETGLLVEPNDVDALREKTKYLMSHPRERIAMGKRALAVAREYTPERHYDALIQHYQSLTA